MGEVETGRITDHSIAGLPAHCPIGLKAMCGKGLPLRMHYLSVESLAKSYGIQPLFSGITFHIE